MSAAALLERLAVAGVKLTALGADRLAAEPAEALTDELRDDIRRHKDELLEALCAKQAHPSARPLTCRSRPTKSAPCLHGSTASASPTRQSARICWRSARATPRRKRTSWRSPHPWSSCGSPSKTERCATALPAPSRCRRTGRLTGASSASATSRLEPSSGKLRRRRSPRPELPKSWDWTPTW